MQILIDEYNLDLINLRNAKAFKTFFAIYFKQICFYVEHIIKNNVEVEDIAIEVFIKFFQSKKIFESKAVAKNYLFKIAKNACIDFLNKQRHQLFQSSQFDFENELLTTSDEREMEYAHLIFSIYKKMEQLPEQCKKICTAYFVDGKDTQTIATEFKISKQTVLNQKAKAIKFL